AGGVIVGKESRSASTTSAASSSAAQSSGVRPDPPQPIPTPQFEPIDFSNQRRSNTGSSEVHQPHTATLGNAGTLQHHHYQQQQQASKTRRSGSISSKVSATTAAATSPAELIIKSIDKDSAAGQAEAVGGQGKAVNGGKGRRNGGNGSGAGGGRVKSRTTATNTPNSDVRQSDLQPILSVPAQPKAAPLQPAQVLKQPKTSIVKPMTHQKPKKGLMTGKFIN
uniref:CG1737 n=1 Tax=Macrostomum lignano TaxID=282301 RepID=A0A1I8HV48_9PLAT